ncbi:cytokine receptor family member b2 [Pygocentrus nattereri]|uniref:Fibronectin type-III domain-containing protein n=1 Tax=Pygocentrus nattereri TaxID=42514 RepID=A0A3B4BT51_PYGNA|nr:cytokine receptor family member b2 [Pygocentrus nattereri]
MDHFQFPLLLTVVLPISVLCIHLPAPVELLMNSQHFVHLLTWQAGPGSPEGVHYTVMFRTQSKTWMTVGSCEVVRSPLWCNLTEVLSDPYEVYYINVSARLGNLTSQPTVYEPFMPLNYTVPELPLLTISPCNESVCVHLQAPSERLRNVYNCSRYTSSCFKYRLDVTSYGEFKFWKETQRLGTVVLEHLVPGQKHCVSVSIISRSSANGPAVCTSTTMASNTDAVISVFSCLAVLLFCAVFCLLFVSGFLCLKTHLPPVLSSFQSPYKVHLLAFPTAESQAPVSLEPNILNNVKGGCKSDGECEGEHENEDEEVAYESLRGQMAPSETSCSSIPPTPDVQYEGLHDGGSVSEVPASPMRVPKALCSIAATEHALKPLCRTGFGFHWKGQTPNQILPAGLSLQELKSKDFLGHKRNEGHDAEAEGNINVNLFSLRRGCIEKEELDEETMGNMESQEMLVPLSPQRELENTTDIKFTYSPSSDRHVTVSEEEEEEEEYSGYMMRN